MEHLNSSWVFDWNVCKVIMKWFHDLLQVTINLKLEHEKPDKARIDVFHYAGGLVEYVLWLNNEKVPS